MRVDEKYQRVFVEWWIEMVGGPATGGTELVRARSPWGPHGALVPGEKTIRGIRAWLSRGVPRVLTSGDPYGYSARPATDEEIEEARQVLAKLEELRPAYEARLAAERDRERERKLAERERERKLARLREEFIGAYVARAPIGRSGWKIRARKRAEQEWEALKVEA